MRIHRVRLRNYRSVVDRIVEFPTEGVTIVEGANEIGKTCIPQAIDLILEKPASSEAKSVKDAKPVHRDEVPEVMTGLSSGPYRFVYSKQWLREPRTTLTVISPRRENLAGREAHERVKAMLAETLDAALWQALRVGQEAGVNSPSFDTPSLLRALDKAAGGVMDGDGEDDLWERICAERERYWTATGLIKARRNSSQKAIEEARKEVEELEQRLKSIESDTEKVEHLAADLPRLNSVRDQCEGNERELKEQLASTDLIRNEAERRKAAYLAAGARRDRVVAAQRRRQCLVEALAARMDELAALEAESQRTEPALLAAIDHSEKAQTDFDGARVALDAAEERQRRINQNRDHYRQRIEEGRLRERYERVLVAQEALSAAEANLDSTKIDDDLVSRIEDARLAMVRAEAAASSVETTAEVDLPVQIGDDQLTLAAGETDSRIVDGVVNVIVLGVVRVRVRAGVGPGNLGVGVDSARREFDRLCAQGEVAGPAEARLAADHRKVAERDRAEAVSAIERDIEDLTVEVMDKKIKALSQKIKGYAAEGNADPLFPVNLEEAELRASEEELVIARLRSDHRGYEATARDALGISGEEKVRAAEFRVRIENARDAVARAEDGLASDREKCSDADMDEALRAVKSEVEDALGLLERARAGLLTADSDSLQARLDNARAARERAADALESNGRQLTELRIRLEILGEQGLHTPLSDAKSKLRQLERKHQRIESRAHAAQFLHTRFEKRRRQARHRYRAPLRTRIEELGRIVFGPTFAVELGEDLSVARRTLDNVTLDVDQLSTGAREQLGLLSRLACAVIVSPDGGGAPVIIDDALGWSDPPHLERMGATIAAAGKECQIIILTCTPGRYAHVGNAKVITLPD